jgi:hypothetical protein
MYVCMCVCSLCISMYLKCVGMRMSESTAGTVLRLWVWGRAELCSMHTCVLFGRVCVCSVCVCGPAGDSDYSASPVRRLRHHHHHYHTHKHHDDHHHHHAHQRGHDELDGSGEGHPPAPLCLPITIKNAYMCMPCREPTPTTSTNTPSPPCAPSLPPPPLSLTHAPTHPPTHRQERRVQGDHVLAGWTTGGLGECAVDPDHRRLRGLVSVSFACRHHPVPSCQRLASDSSSTPPTALPSHTPQGPTAMCQHKDSSQGSCASLRHAIDYDALQQGARGVHTGTIHNALHTTRTHIHRAYTHPHPAHPYTHAPHPTASWTGF